MKKKYITGARHDASPNEREKENQRLSYLAALEGIVLLENDGALPMSKGKVALYGSGAKYTVKGGKGSGEVNERHSVSIYEGLCERGFTVSSESWLDDYDAEYSLAHSKYIAERTAAAKGCGLDFDAYMDVGNRTFILPDGRDVTEDDVNESDTDTAIYVVSRHTGESVDRRPEKYDLYLSDKETDQIRFLSEHYKNTVLVINSGSMVSFASLEGVRLSAVIYICLLGSEGGRALADILSGDASPSGRLTDSWQDDYGEVPFGDEYSYLNSDTEHEYYREGIYVGYKYYDSFNKSVRYPFGYGLSYTEFDISVKELYRDKSNIKLDVTVKNTGCASGREVVQVYASLPEGALRKEYQRLVAFGKTSLLVPSEEETLTLEFDMEYCASYSEELSSTLLEKGNYVIRVGRSSRNTVVAGVVTLNDTAILKKHKNLFAPESKVDEIEPPVYEHTVPNGVTTINIDASEFETEVLEYKRAERPRDERVNEIMSRLSTNDMIDVCVGAGPLGLFMRSPICTPGAIGSTTDHLYKKGLINVNLVDGPAGVRILRRSVISGCMIRMVDYMMSFFAYFPKLLLKILCADEKSSNVVYQYCTAFPVGTALAQSWNTELCLEVGRAISREMDEYCASCWLAPALNIHKNPLGGRNFEYFSEDPVLSGKIAAALTRGVEEGESCIATVKHFACNSCEEDRKHSNSIINERALREVYLRGFEICIKEASPGALMTSYNKLNGVYTPNSYPLINDLLRCEWGFDGLVMSDWNSTDKGLADTAEAIRVGNDLIMQGGGYYKKEIKRALAEKRLSKSELECACANVVRMILNSGVSKRS